MDNSQQLLHPNLLHVSELIEMIKDVSHYRLIDSIKLIIDFSDKFK